MGRTEATVRTFYNPNNLSFETILSRLREFDIFAGIELEDVTQQNDTQSNNYVHIISNLTDEQIISVLSLDSNGQPTDYTAARQTLRDEYLDAISQLTLIVNASSFTNAQVASALRLLARVARFQLRQVMKRFMA